MDQLVKYSQLVMGHVQEYAVAYVLVFICLIPVIYVTRRYSLPLIQYTAEIIIYLTVMHVVMWMMVAVALWFRKESSFKRAFDSEGRLVTQTEWGTPLVEFWDRSQYVPQGIFWFELIAAVLILIAVFKYRPLKIQRGRKWQFDERKGKKARPQYRGNQQMLSGTGAKPAGGRGGRR